MIYAPVFPLVVREVSSSERLWLLLVKSFSPSPVCDRLGVSSLAFRRSPFRYRCRHTVVAVDPSLISFLSLSLIWGFDSLAVTRLMEGQFFDKEILVPFRRWKLANH